MCMHTHTLHFSAEFFHYQPYIERQLETPELIVKADEDFTESRNILNNNYLLDFAFNQCDIYSNNG